MVQKYPNRSWHPKIEVNEVKKSQMVSPPPWTHSILRHSRFAAGKKTFFNVKYCIFTNLISKYFTQQHLEQKISPFLQV